MTVSRALFLWSVAGVSHLLGEFTSRFRNVFLRVVRQVGGQLTSTLAHGHMAQNSTPPKGQQTEKVLIEAYEKREGAFARAL